MIPFQGDATVALKEILKVWPQLRPNEIRVTNPAGQGAAASSVSPTTVIRPAPARPTAVVPVFPQPHARPAPATKAAPHERPQWKPKKENNERMKPVGKSAATTPEHAWRYYLVGDAAPQAKGAANAPDRPVQSGSAGRRCSAGSIRCGPGGFPGEAGHRRNSGRGCRAAAGTPGGADRGHAGRVEHHHHFRRPGSPGSVGSPGAELLPRRLGGAEHDRVPAAQRKRERRRDNSPDALQGHAQRTPVGRGRQRRQRQRHQHGDRHSRYAIERLGGSSQSRRPGHRGEPHPHARRGRRRPLRCPATL